MTLKMEVTTAISLTVERYNELIQAEPYKRLLEKGFVDVELVSFRNSVRISVPATIALGQLVRAAAELMPISDFGGELHARNVEGILLENNRPLSDYGFRYGERLFVERAGESRQ